MIRRVSSNWNLKLGERYSRPADSLNVGNNMRIRKYLGGGGEGDVYLLQNATDGALSVLKVFHQARPGRPTQGLQIYADELQAGYEGLPQITLLSGSDDEIVGVIYPFTPLFHVHSRIYHTIPQIAQALLGAYCRMQAHLIREHHIAIKDAPCIQFMLAPSGHFHFVDFGWSVTWLDHPRAVQRGEFAYSFVRLILSIYNEGPSAPLNYGYSYTDPCIYSMDPALSKLADRHEWLRHVVSMMREQDASVFLQAAFYEQLSRQLPARVQFPRMVILCSRALQSLYTRLRGVHYSNPEPPLSSSATRIIDELNSAPVDFR